MGYIGIQTLPTIYVDNNTASEIENLSFTFDGNESKEPKIKKIKSGERNQVSIYTRGIKGTKVLLMKHGDQIYEVFNELTATYRSNILVEIQTIKDDGTLEIKVTTNIGF